MSSPRMKRKDGSRWARVSWPRVARRGTVRRGVTYIILTAATDDDEVEDDGDG